MEKRYWVELHGLTKYDGWRKIARYVRFVKTAYYPRRPLHIT